MLRPFPVLLLATALTAQAPHGRVLGFTGEPVAKVMLNLEDAGGNYLADTSTGADGSYRFRANTTAARVTAWLEGVELTVPLPDNGAADFCFRDAKYFTLHGHAVDPEGRVLAALEVQCRDAKDNCLASFVTDAKGAFRIRCNHPLDHLLVDPDAWRHQVKGPFAADRGVDINLRPEHFFRLTGLITDENGKPVAGAALNAYDAQGKNAAIVSSGADGRYQLWANREVVQLHVSAGEFVRCQLPGPWAKAATVDVDWRRAGLVVVTGKVLDSSGKPVADTPLIPTDTRPFAGHALSPVGKTSADGSFRVLVPSTCRFLLAHVGDVDAYADGPWPKDAVVELRPAK